MRDEENGKSQFNQILEDFQMIKIIMCIVSIDIALLFCAGCQKIYCDDDIPPQPVSVKQALEIAQPYLDLCYQLKEGQENTSDARTPSISICLKGNYYYIVKYEYPRIEQSFYVDHAVKVHKVTGAVISPR